jgi:hypothetical protein
MGKGDSIAKKAGEQVCRARRVAREATAQARAEQGDGQIAVTGRTNVVVKANIGHDDHAIIAHAQQDAPIVQGPSEGEPSSAPRSGT